MHVGVAIEPVRVDTAFTDCYQCWSVMKCQALLWAHDVGMSLQYLFIYLCHSFIHSFDIVQYYA